MINFVSLYNKGTPKVEISFGQRVTPKDIKIEDKEEGKIVSCNYSSGIHTEININTGEYTCNCDYASDTYYCRHVVGLLLTLDRTHGELVDEFERTTPPWRSSDAVSTGVKTIDNLMEGGFTRGAITILSGTSKAGKTFLALQTAVNHYLKTGEHTLYLDLENMFAIPSFYKGFLNVISKKYPKVKEDFRGIDIYSKLNYKKMFDLLNKSVSVYGRSKLSLNVTERDIKSSPLYDMLSKKKYGMIVLDSFTGLFKDISGLTEPSNFSTRSALISLLWSAFEELAYTFNVAVVFISHVSLDRIRNSPKIIAETPATENTSYLWGGQSLLYKAKIIYFMSGVNENDFSYFKGKKINIKEVRVFARRLHPFAKNDYIFVINKHGEGFKDWEIKL